MQNKLIVISLLITSALMGCKSLSVDNAIGFGAQAFQTATLSDDDIRQLSSKSCQEMDNQAKIAPANSKYTQRINKIANKLGHDINGVKTNYKVYLSNEQNAWAMANGCIRVYSGLMDIFTDNEIEGVLGHEIGHVALGHSKKAIQVAYSTAIARDVIASTTSGAVAALTQSQLGDLAQQVINSQFSQSQEMAADNFSFDYLKTRGIKRDGLLSSFEKFAKMDGSSSTSLLSSHPSSTKRADNIRKRLSTEK